MTLEASPLSNRGYEVPPEYGCSQGKHSEGVPQQLNYGRPLQGRFFLSHAPRGCSLCSYPRLLRGDRVAVLPVVSY